MAGPESTSIRARLVLVMFIHITQITLEEGTFHTNLDFVPMGDSPSKIRIDIKVRSAGSDFAGTTWTPMFSEIICI